MTRSEGPVLPRAVLTTLGAAPFSSALSLTIIGCAFLSLTIGRLIGPAGLDAMIGTLAVLAALSLAGRRDQLEWRGLLPISLMAFVAWGTLSMIWSNYNWATLAGLFPLIGYGFLGVYIALVRDAIQIVRAVGDVLRVVLAGSLLIELVTGILLDSPFRLLGIQGNLGQGGPIQGLLGIRNQLGVVALIALVTFAIEWATKSVRRELAIASIIGAVAVLGFTRSPVATSVAVIAALAALALIGLRRIPAEQRRFWQFSLLLLAVIGLALAWLLRTRIILLLNAGTEFEYRYSLWRQVFQFAAINPLQGWGWIGSWDRDIAPFTAIGQAGSRTYETALSAYVDVYLQLGIVGLAIFLGLVVLALVRSWLLASDRRSVVYLWPALTLVILVFASAAESVLIADWGWLLFVVATVRASKELSWRQALG